MAQIPLSPGFTCLSSEQGMAPALCSPPKMPQKAFCPGLWANRDPAQSAFSLFAAVIQVGIWVFSGLRSMVRRSRKM